MMHSAARWRAWIVRQATATPRRAAVSRYVLSLGLIAALFAIIPHTPIDGPIAGVFALSSVIVCCWYGGVGPALLMPLTVWLSSRLSSGLPAQPLIPSAQELMTFFGLSMLTGAVGLAGQFRNRLRAATREHNAQMRQQAQALSAARIVFRDVEGQITTWTDGARELYGWSSDEAVGQFICELLRTELPAPPEAIRAEILRTGQWQGEVIQTTKDGDRLNVVIHSILYPGTDHAPPGVAEVHNDVTALRLAEAAIRDSDRRKDLFVATLAHELRNPLAPLRSGLGVLRMTRNGSADDHDILMIMERQVEHMVRLVDDLLDVSRISTGKVKLRLAPILLEDVIRDAIATCGPQIEAARHKFITTLPDERLYLEADAARLVQVLTNLLSNAAKFTDPGGEVRLSVVREGPQVTLCVQDTGAGISAESLSQVFDMFAQVEDPKSRSRGGLGLGLHIVRTLVEMHGGTVEAHSDGAGCGTSFIVRLPLLLTPAALDPEPRNNNSVPKSLPASRRVLVVDDNRDAARTLELMLTKAGFECRSVFDGPSALHVADEFAPHAVVLDLGMPGMGGLDVARRFRENASHQDVVLIAVTGWDKEDDRQRSREAGFDHHFAKPVRLDALRELIGSIETNPQ